MEKTFEHFTVSILKLNKLVQRIKIYEMDKYGLKAVHVMCGYYLEEHPEGLTATELAKFAIEDKAAISRALLQMKERGYVNYDTKTYNAKITLTDEGRRLAGIIRERADRAVNAGSAVLSEEERIRFYQTLTSIADNLSAYYRSLTDGSAEEDIYG